MSRLSSILIPLKIAAFFCLLGTAQPSLLAAEEPTCGRQPYDAPDQVAELVFGMEPVFAAFPAMQKLIDDVAPEICIEEGMFEMHGYFEPESNRIVIDGSLNVGLQQAILVHELRHVGQFTSGICLSPNLSMVENARAVFGMEADASVSSAVVAWAMREAGSPQMWDAISEWPMQQDIAAVFADKMQNSNDIGVAAGAAFAAWYSYEPRLDLYYLAACSSYLDREESSNRLRRYDALSPSFYGKLCYLPTGDSYACGDPR